jgi:predicted integral membrane protein DUF2269
MTAAADSSVPTGAAFSILLVLHVVAVAVAFATVVASGVMARRVRTARGEPLPTSVTRYFAPGVNWAGRAVHLVPVFGLLLLWSSHGAYDLGERWVQWGLGLWVAAGAACEGVLWPAERRVQSGLSDAAEKESGRLPGNCSAVWWTAIAVAAVLVAASVVMVAKP